MNPSLGSTLTISSAQVKHRTVSCVSYTLHVLFYTHAIYYSAVYLYEAGGLPSNIGTNGMKKVVSKARSLSDTKSRQ